MGHSLASQICICLRVDRAGFCVHPHLGVENVLPTPLRFTPRQRCTCEASILETGIYKGFKSLVTTVCLVCTSISSCTHTLYFGKDEVICTRMCLLDMLCVPNFSRATNQYEFLSTCVTSTFIKQAAMHSYRLSTLASSSSYASSYHHHRHQISTVTLNAKYNGESESTFLKCHCHNQ